MNNAKIHARQLISKIGNSQSFTETASARARGYPASGV
jgi:hypothetical protein